MSLLRRHALLVDQGLDPDAEAFLIAISNTDSVIESAIDKLFKGLKSNGIYSKMLAFYPFVGGTANSHKFNMVNPVDSDAAFRLTFTGTWTHNSNGALPSSSYANTFFNPFVEKGGDLFLGSFFYSVTDATTGTDQVDFGARESVNNFWGSIRYNGYGFDNILGRNTSSVSSLILDGGTVTDSLGLIQIHRTLETGLNTAALYKNNTQLDTNTNNAGQPNIDIYLGAFNLNGTPSLYTNRQCAAFGICDGLNSSQASILYTLIQNFQTTLGRQV